MSPDRRSTLIHLASFGVALVVACRVRRLPLRETLALAWPGARRAAVWLAAFALLAVSTQLVSRGLGLEEITRVTSRQESCRSQERESA